MFLSKRIILSSMVAALGLTTLKSCKPHEFIPELLSSFAVINAVPRDTFHVTLDNQLHTGAVIASGNASTSHSGVTTIYLPTVAGTKTLGLSRDTGKTNFMTQSVTLETGVSQTFVVVGEASNRKVVRLRDDLTNPETDRVKVRFLHLAPTTAAVDVTFARGTTDSVTLTNRMFLGNATDVTPQETFISLPLTPNRTPALPTVPTNATNYTVRVKTSGTGNVISTATVTLGGAYNNPQNKVYTAYLRGGASTVALSTTTIRNY
jgi:hypothetical protein